MSNVREFSERATIEQQAREWLIRLDGDEPLTSAESDALRRWLDRSPTHRAELGRIARLWNSASVLTELAVPLPTRSAAPSRLWAMAASLLLILAGVGSWWKLAPQGISNGSFETAVGEQQRLPLEDGSSVQLNTDTQIRVSYSSAAREVHLLRGEALFRVAHEPTRPFEVHAANGGVVRAIGTAFSVQVVDGELDVAVTEGRVQVTTVRASGTTTPPETLGAGQAASFRPGSHELRIVQLRDEELRRRLAWHEGYLVFAGEPLSDVVAQMNRYSSRRLDVADPGLARLAIGGRFKVGDLDALLDVLRTHFGIHTRQEADGSILLERARAPSSP